jgi:membrane associated rhomboid family serine protease
MFIPYQVDVPMDRWPVGNVVLIGLISLSSIAALIGGEIRADSLLVLNGWSPVGALGYVFLHADFIHLIGNMLFLWVFGNAVCAKIGNIVYPPIFLALGVAAATAHNLFGEGPAVGASGAINGVIGMYLVLYPINEISCFWTFFYRGGTFSVSSVWMILLWLAFDIWGAASGGGNVAYWAHLGGFVLGAGATALAVAVRWIEMDPDEKSLLDVIRGE